MASEVRRWLRRIWVVAGLSFTAWLAWNLQAHGVPDETMQSTARVVVTEEADTTYFVPQPAADSMHAVLVFVPGGLVDPRAYQPIVRQIADSGTPAALVEMPFRSAMTEGQRSQLWRRIRAARARLGAGSPLVIAGHSRGAAMAARFANEFGAEVGGLALIGTTHPRDFDLSRATYPVLKIAGTRDCVAPTDDARANAHLLPGATEWAVIDGGNHAQFGYYGSQINDCSAEITREEQHRQMLSALTGIVARVSGPR
jgi:pimeloyl-ACP methyl ester carboxylesterase